jgi:hypothetical protein
MSFCADFRYRSGANSPPRIDTKENLNRGWTQIDGDKDRTNREWTRIDANILSGGGGSVMGGTPLGGSKAS